MLEDSTKVSLSRETKSQLKRTMNISNQLDRFLSTGKGRLEVCGNGSGSSISLDLYTGSLGRYSGYYFASANLVRRSGANRQEV